MKRLAEIRVRIDILDWKIADLLQERASLALETVKIKTELSQPIHDEEREEKILETVSKSSHGPLPDKSIKRIYATIIEECRTLEESN
ncbi:MAG: chorismate mutase [bacterium]